MNGNGGADSEQERMQRVRTVKEAHEQELMGCANVVGVGVGLVERGGQLTNDVGIVVMVSRKVPRNQLAAKDVIPRELDGVPVDVKEVGEIRAQ
jgi:hypothetical protein